MLNVFDKLCGKWVALEFNVISENASRNGSNTLVADAEMFLDFFSGERIVINRYLVEPPEEIVGTIWIKSERQWSGIDRGRSEARLLCIDNC